MCSSSFVVGPDSGDGHERVFPGGRAVGGVSILGLELSRSGCWPMAKASEDGVAHSSEVITR